jgi:hypothetical protein
MEGNEVRGIAMEHKFKGTADCGKSGLTHPVAELMLKASGELLLQPFVQSPLNTLAEPLLDATAAVS